MIPFLGVCGGRFKLGSSAWLMQSKAQELENILVNVLNEDITIEEGIKDYRALATDSVSH